MAVALDGFSIRGYTAKKRTMGIDKCLPFPGAGTAPSLPPISVPKFRWWSDELESEQLLHSDLDLKNDTSGTVSGIKLTVRNPGKGKQRLPKKQSIAELFVVAPQIDVNNTDDGSEGEQGDGDVGAGTEEQEGKTNRPETADGSVVDPDGAVSGLAEKPRKAEERGLTKMSNNRKKKSTKLEICSAKEEKIHKPKISCVVHISNLLRGPTSKRIRKKHKILGDGQKNKPPNRKHLSKKQSSEVAQSSKSLVKDQEGSKVIPARSILKNKKQVSSLRKTFEGDTHVENSIKPHHESEKHVTFSAKDHVLGHNKSCSSIHMPKLKRHCQSIADTLAASSTIKDAAAILADNSVSSLSEKKLLVGECHAVVYTDIGNMNNVDTKKTSILASLDLNCAVQSIDQSDYSDPGVSALSPNYSTAGSSLIRNAYDIEGLSSNTGFQEAQSSAGFQVESSFMTSNARRNPDSNGITSSNLTITATIMREFVTDQPSMQANDCGPHLSLETKINTAWHTPKYHSACDIVGLNNHVELRTSPDSLSICRENSTAYGLTGFPLGSEGELIKSYSSDDSMRNADPTSQQEPNPLGSGRSFRESTLPANQKTMRLMGKDFTVGENSIACEASDDGKIRSVKVIIAQQCPDAPSCMPCPLKDQIAQNCLHQLETPSNHYHVPRTDPLLSRMHSDRTPQWVSSTGHFSIMENHHPNGNMSCQRLLPKEFESKAAESIFHRIPVTECFEMANRMPVIPSHRQIASHQILRNSMDCKCNQIHSSRKTSTFCSQVPDPENMNSAKPFSASKSSHLPQWLLNAKREKNHQIPFRDTDPYWIHAGHSHTLHKTNFLCVPSSHQASVVPFFDDAPFKKCCSPSQVSSIHPALLSSCTARKSTVAVNPVIADRIKRTDGRESNFDFFEILDGSNSTRKRLSTGGDDFMRQVKKPSVAVYRRSMATSRPRPLEQLAGCMRFTSTENPKTPTYGYKVMDADIVTLNNEKYGLIPTSQSCSLEHDDVSKQGPDKLIAGAKHILKPNKNVDEYNSRPVHSSIPFANEFSSGISSASQKKATKICKF